MRKSVMAVVAVLSAMALPNAAVGDAAAQTHSAYEAGLRMAKRRHVANPRCYALVFEQYATLNRYARWRWPTAGRRMYRVQQVYQQDLFQRCGVA